MAWSMESGMAPGRKYSRGHGAAWFISNISKSYIPESLLLPLSHCAWFRETVIVDHNHCSILQRWDQVAKYVDAVPVRPIVEDPTK